MSRLVRRTAAVLAAAVAALTLATATASSQAPAPETPAIVNGTEVSDGDYAARWPFIVAIVGADADSQYEGQFCGGSLIDDQHVLTAAHCLTFDDGVVSAAAGIRVVARSRTLNRVSLGTGETGARRVSDVFIHPDFAENAGDGFRSDVAILRLAAPVAGASTIGIVQPGETALWGGGAGGVNAFVAGWGDTDPRDERDPDTKFPSSLRQTTIPLRSDATCGATVGGGYGTAFERATNLCAGTLQSGRTLGSDSCQGDSGGPLLVDAGAGSYRLAGITSWGEGCAERQFGAYTRIDALRTWVNSLPGATDGGAATGGPAGTLGVANLRRAGGDYTHVSLAWDAAPDGTPAERYAVWRQTRVEGELAETLVGITTATSFTAPAIATRRANAYVWDVRPLDAGGSNGPQATLKAGPRPDITPPTRVRTVGLASRTARSLLVRWSVSADRQSGIDGYQVQRRVVGRGGFVTVDFTSAFPRASRIVGLRAGDRVQVRVRSFDDAGNASAFSPIATFATLR
ncbi:MAG: peptidase family protein [Thermoleophilia bacterium]|nr:peptidase family protein [Thermoleophilia bacterium]